MRNVRKCGTCAGCAGCAVRGAGCGVRAVTVMATLLLLATIAAGGGHAAAQAPGDFAALDAAGRRGMLGSIGSSRLRLDIADVIAIARAGLQDADSGVRAAALVAIAGRAMASRIAGVTTPMLGPAPPGWPAPKPPREPIPAAWQGDQQRLRDSVSGDCVRLLRGDADDRVRAAALMALANVERPSGTDGSWSPAFVELLIERFHQDTSQVVRTDAMKGIALMSNDGAAIRAAFAEGLVDPQPGVRHHALGALERQAMSGREKLAFGEARKTLERALTSPDPQVRLGAVQALNVYGAAASGFVSRLEALGRTDPDQQVRTSAGPGGRGHPSRSPVTSDAQGEGRRRDEW